MANPMLSARRAGSAVCAATACALALATAAWACTSTQPNHFTVLGTTAINGSDQATPGTGQAGKPATAKGYGLMHPTNGVNIYLLEATDPVLNNLNDQGGGFIITEPVPVAKPHGLLLGNMACHANGPGFRGTLVGSDPATTAPIGAFEVTFTVPGAGPRLVWICANQDDGVDSTSFVPFVVTPA